MGQEYTNTGADMLTLGQGDTDTGFTKSRKGRQAHRDIKTEKNTEIVRHKYKHGDTKANTAQITLT